VDYIGELHFVKVCDVIRVGRLEFGDVAFLLDDVNTISGHLDLLYADPSVLLGQAFFMFLALFATFVAGKRRQLRCLGGGKGGT
jgi:hypothetical protein